MQELRAEFFTFDFTVIVLSRVVSQADKISTIAKRL